MVIGNLSIILVVYFTYPTIHENIDTGQPSEPIQLICGPMYLGLYLPLFQVNTSIYQDNLKNWMIEN